LLCLTMCVTADFSVSDFDTKFFYYTYDKKETPLITFSGIFPSDDISQYKVSIGAGLANCKPTTVTTKTLQCQVDQVKAVTSAKGIDISVVYETITFTFARHFSIYIPQLHYITPYSVPTAVGSEFRIAITDLLISRPVEFRWKDVTFEILERQAEYVVLRIPENFPKLDVSKYVDLDIVDLESTKIITSYPLSFVLLNSPTYISSTSPSWLPTGGNYQPRKVIINGKGLKDAEAMSINHPWANIEIYAHIDPETPSTNTQATFIIPTLSFWNTTIFQGFNDTNYQSLDMYEGPIRFDLYTKDMAFVASGELTYLSPTYGLEEDKTAVFFPARQIPSNLIPTTQISLKLAKFPASVPTQLRFDQNKWSLQRAAEKLTVGSFIVENDLITFYPPQCKDCTLPFTASLCLSPVDSNECMISLGNLTYDTPSKTTTVLTSGQSWPKKHYFENLEEHIDISWYGAPPSLSDMVFRRGDLSIAPTSSRLLTTNMARITLPPRCANEFCPAGFYTPDYPTSEVVHLETDKTKFSINNDTAVHVKWVLDIPFNQSDQDSINRRVQRGISNPNKPYHLQRFSNNFFFAIEEYNVAIEEYNDVSIKGITMVNFIIRPSVSGENDSVALAKELQASLEDGKSYLHVNIPQLLVDGASFTEVNYCEKFHKYTNEPCPATDDDDHKNKSVPVALIVVGMIALSILFIGLVIWLVKTQTNLLKKRNEESLLEGSYEAIQ